MSRVRHGPAAAEWVTLTISLLIVGAMLAIGLREEFQRHEALAGDLEVTFDPGQAERRGKSYFVPYLIRNTGADAIASAELWIEVYAGEELVESAEENVSALPLQGTQPGIYVTTRDPATHEFRARMESLQFP